MKQTKIVILGAGHVGTHCALSLMFRSLANEIVLIDTDEEKAKSQALDLDDMGACLPAKVVIRSGSYEDLDDADILVNAIGRSRKEGETRLDMFGDSMERLKDIIPRFKIQVSRNSDQYYKSCGCSRRMFEESVRYREIPLL